MSEPNYYVLEEGIDYDLPHGTPWRLEQEGPPLILKNDPHPASELIPLPSGYSYNPWPETTTCFPVCLELSDQGPPGDYMSLLLYHQFPSQTMGYIVLEWVHMSIFTTLFLPWQLCSSKMTYTLPTSQKAEPLQNWTKVK